MSISRRAILTRPEGLIARENEDFISRSIEVYDFPCLTIATIDVDLVAALCEESSSVLLVFTSSNAVAALKASLENLPNLVRDKVLSLTVAVVGSSTAKLASEAGFSVELIPQSFNAETLANEIISSRKRLGSPARIIHVCGTSSSSLLTSMLEEHDFSTERLEVYQVSERTFQEDAFENLVAWVKSGVEPYLVFTSSLSARVFYRSFSKLSKETQSMLAALPVVAIGGKTENRLRELGISVAVSPSEATLAAVAEAITNCC